MSIPGFRAEVTIYRSSITYRAAWTSGEALGLGVDPQFIAALERGGAVFPAACTACSSDISFPTGCSKECFDKFGNSTGQQACSGCANACAGGRFCNGICRDIKNDRNNCGACGNVCPPGVSCVNGACGCPPGQITCSGKCTSTNVDPKNCGACGIVCGTGQICQDGRCVEANCRVFCSTWNSCIQKCGPWPPDSIGAAGCWKDCLVGETSCLNSTCANV